MTIVHGCRFVKWQPDAINAMDMAPLGCHPLLAVVRKNGDLEVWDASQNWTVKRIPAGGRVGRAIECVTWLDPRPNQRTTSPKDKKTLLISNVGSKFGCPLTKAVVLPWKLVRQLPMGRLFTAGHDGYLVEWNVSNKESDRPSGDVDTSAFLRPHRYLEVGTGGIWCMARSPDNCSIALGCEHGTIRVVQVDGPSHSEKDEWRTSRTIRLPTKEDTQLLSMSWYSESNTNWLAVSTSEGSIFILDMNEAARPQPIVNRIEMDSLNALVWCVRFAGPTLVSGNSLGQVQFWDARLGTILTTINHSHHHSTDVFTIAVHSSHKRVFTSASDGRSIDLYNYGEGDCPKWRIRERITAHRHDVKASICGWIPIMKLHKEKVIVSAQDVFISGGTGTNLAIFKLDALEAERIRFISPLSMVNQSLVVVAREARMIAANLGQAVGVWKLGQFAPRKDEHDPRQWAQSGRFLVQLSIPWEESVQCLDLSVNGRFLVYATRSTMRLYQLQVISKDEQVNDIELHKLQVSLEPASRGVISALAFSPDSRHLAIATPGKLTILNVVEDSTGNALQQSSVYSLCRSNTALTKLIWSGSKKLLGLDADNRLYLLPSRQAPINLGDYGMVTAMTALDNDERVLAITSDKKFILVNTTSGHVKSLESNLPESWVTDLEIIHYIAVTSTFGDGQSQNRSNCRLLLCSQRYIVETELSTLEAHYGQSKKAIGSDSIEGTEINPSSLVKQQHGKRKRRSSQVKSQKRHSSFQVRDQKSPVDRYHYHWQDNQQYDFGPHLQVHKANGLVLGLDYLDGDSEAVLVERPWEDIVEALPPPQDRKEYGGF